MIYINKCYIASRNESNKLCGIVYMSHETIDFRHFIITAFLEKKQKKECFLFYASLFSNSTLKTITMAAKIIRQPVI